MLLLCRLTSLFPSEAPRVLPGVMLARLVVPFSRGWVASLTWGWRRAAAPKEAVAHSPVLYSLEDSAWGKIKEGTLSYDDIADDDVMLIDIGTSLFVMVGSTAPREEQTQCMIMAQKFLDDNTVRPSPPQLSPTNDCRLDPPVPLYCITSSSAYGASTCF